ncbi:MAG: 3-hydroxyacyl-CoA dehydrogenase NAD-binding domain-containing protein [Pirellula sp.]
MASNEFSSDVDSAIGGCGEIRTVLVIGAGWVGRQIVGQFIAHGLCVTWLDQSSDALNSGLTWIAEHRAEICSANQDSIERAIGGGSSCEEVRTCTNIDDAGSPIDLVLETVSEQVSVKRKVLELVSARYPAPTVIASNSSYFTPSILSRFVHDSSRFANFHFHVPVWQTRLVDIASSPNTSKSTLERLSELSIRVGLHPLVQRVENPGYVFNWMLKAVLQSALQLRAKDVASPEDIDLAWKKVTGMPLGPFGMMDQIGLDLVYQTMSAARFVDGDAAWQPLLDQLSPLIDEGRLGVKVGCGFYKYGEFS